MGRGGLFLASLTTIVAVDGGGGPRQAVVEFPIEKEEINAEEFATRVWTVSVCGVGYRHRADCLGKPEICCRADFGRLFQLRRDNSLLL